MFVGLETNAVAGVEQRSGQPQERHGPPQAYAAHGCGGAAVDAYLVRPGQQRDKQAIAAAKAQPEDPHRHRLMKPWTRSAPVCR